jgi:phage tail sheath protein FI
MLESNIFTPGVYINEINAFPNSVVAVATAIPAFIGYTPQASYQGISYLNTPQAVTSFAEFQAIYCLPNPASPAPPAKQYSPQYYLVAQKSKPANQDYIVIDNVYYALVPDPNTIYYLYNSVQMFFQNGGGTAYIVSVGGYGPPSNTPMAPSTQIVNPNVQLSDLLGGLALLQNEEDPTMYICPEATLLSVADNGTLMQAMLLQNSNMMTAISIFDIIGGRNPDPIMYTNDIATFRSNTGVQGLSYGTAYYPFIGTTTMQQQNIDYTNLFGGDVKQLLPLLSPADNPDQVTASIIANIPAAATSTTVLQYNNALITASQTYNQLMTTVLNAVNMLPPSGAMAGVMTTIDNQYGVWEAPANTNIIGAAGLPLKLSDTSQANINVDALTGKSINAIRSFTGLGILVWGARTLDGNSGDWKYLSVRRTAMMIENSCKLAARNYVFQPNTKNTWEAVKAMISSFLMNVWQEGGLQGATPSDAYSVNCGLGTTMTGDDILGGFMIVTVLVAIARPAEFIVINFQQEMPVSS